MSFKTLTLANWLAPDPTSSQFWQLSRALARPVTMDGHGWAREFLAVELAGHVPADVRDLFAVARGMAVYGWLFYPLYRQAEDQMHRVVEAAAKEAYSQVGGERHRATYEQAIEMLVSFGVIPTADTVRWTAARHLRNVGSHPKEHSATTPGSVLHLFKTGAHDINRLFARAKRARHEDAAPLTEPGRTRRRP